MANVRKNLVNMSNPFNDVFDNKDAMFSHFSSPNQPHWIDYSSILTC